MPLLIRKISVQRYTDYKNAAVALVKAKDDMLKAKTAIADEATLDIAMSPVPNGVLQARVNNITDDGYAIVQTWTKLNTESDAGTKSADEEQQ